MLLAWQACGRRHSSSSPLKGLLRVLGNRLLHQHMHSMSFQDAIATLNEHLAKPPSAPLPSSPGSPPRRVTRFKFLYKYLKALELEEPLSRLSVIHVAGTKGKGSTCAFTESILRSCGYRTGLFTSPHLVDIRERFRFSGQLVSEEVFAKHFWWCWNRLQAATSATLPMPWFFSFLTLLALKMFTVEKVDVAILEVGIGGLYDATNVVGSPSVCGIASLGYDHMEILGNTLAEIATQKAGIFKAGVPAFSVPQQPEAMEALCKQARSLSVPLSIAPALETYAADSISLGLDGEHQRVNAALAIALCVAWEKKLRSSSRLATLEEGRLPDGYLHGLANTAWPGRGQVYHDVGLHPRGLNGEAKIDDSKTGSLTFYLDGAHTPESLEVCGKWFCSAATRESTHGKEKHVSWHCEINGSNGHGIKGGQWATNNGREKANYKRILLFSCMPKRDPQLLFPCLIQTCKQSGLHIDTALFVPPLSTVDAIETRSVSDICSSAMESEPDLSWQILLKETWESLQEMHEDIQLSDGLKQLTRYLDEDENRHLRHQCILGSSNAVIPSLPAALNWLRCWASSNPVKLQVLVTGSLYLVGDLLKICKQGLCPEDMQNGQYNHIEKAKLWL